MGVDVNEIKKRKEIGRLHRFRERIQQLNEDLNVLIFEGEEDIDLQVEEQFQRMPPNEQVDVAALVEDEGEQEEE